MAENAHNRPVRRPVNRSANSLPSATPTPQVPAVAPAASPPKPTSNMQQIKELLLGKINAIRRVIPPGVPVTAEGLVQNALQYLATAKDVRLRQCTPQSVFYAVLACAATGLDLVAEQGYLISMEKRKSDGRGGWAHDHFYCTFWASYKGLITVAARAGFFMDPHEVCAHDAYECHLGTRNEVLHSVGFGDRGAIQGFYLVIRNDRGQVHRIERMCKADVDQAMQDTDAWKKHYDRMGLKTIVKRGYNLLPKNTREAKLLAQVEEHNDAEQELTDLVEGDLVGAEGSASSVAHAA